MADIKIDAKLFQERINHFVNAWKADKRAGDQIFSGVSSIVILLGKVEENPEFHKNNAMHVRTTSFSVSNILSSSFVVLALATRPAANYLFRTVLVVRLRVPNYPHAPHPRDPLHCHDRKERCDVLSQINAYRMADYS